MAANNFYLSLTLANANTSNPETVVTAATTNAGPAQGTAADFEFRIQTDTGTGPNAVNKQDCLLALALFAEFIETNGSNHAGANIPAL